MRQKKIVVKINKPAVEVFDFCLNPRNTPKWIESIVEEETNEWPPRAGTVYRNKNREGKWNEYTLTEFVKNKMFVMTSKDGNYHVRYTLAQINKNSCELEYFEWVDEGELAEPFSLGILEKLKVVVEKN